MTSINEQLFDECRDKFFSKLTQDAQEYLMLNDSRVTSPLKTILQNRTSWWVDSKWSKRLTLGKVAVLTMQPWKYDRYCHPTELIDYYMERTPLRGMKMILNYIRDEDVEKYYPKVDPVMELKLLHIFSMKGDEEEGIMEGTWWVRGAIFSVLLHFLNVGGSNFSQVNYNDFCTPINAEFVANDGTEFQLSNFDSAKELEVTKAACPPYYSRRFAIVEESDEEEESDESDEEEDKENNRTPQ